MKNCIKIILLNIAAAVLCLNASAPRLFARAMSVRGKSPVQTVKIKAVINPRTETVTGSEIIRYIKYNKDSVLNLNGKRKPREIKNFGGKLKNFRGIDLNISRRLYIMLYPNSLYKRPENIKDFDFHQLYPYGFNRGYISINNLSEELIINKFYKLYIIKIAFRTKIPEAFGNFGYFNKETVLNAPFYPYISAGKNFNPPMNIDFKINLTVKHGYEAIFNGNIYKGSFFIHKRSNFISLISAKKFKINKTFKNGLSLKFFQPYPYNFKQSNKKIYRALVLLDKYNTVKLKKISVVYIHLRRSLWLKPPLYSNTLLVNSRFGNIFPTFYIYQKLNIIKGLIYLGIINDGRILKKINKSDSLLYSQNLQKLSFIGFRKFLNAYIKRNPDIKNTVKGFNFIQGVNTVINYPIFPLSYLYFTGFSRTHRLKNGVYYYNNDLNLISYKKIKEKILNRKKNDYYTLFLSGAGGNISPNSGRTEGYLNFTLTKRYSYRNGILFNIFKNYYNRGASLGFSHQLGRFFPVSQIYRQSVSGLINFMEISPSASGDSIIYQNTKRLAEFTLSYSYNSVDYNINPEYGSSFNFSYNIANSNILSPFSFSQFVLQYVKNFAINEDNIVALKGIGVFADGSVPAALDYYLGGINGIMGVPASLPFVDNDTLIAEADYRRNICRGLNLNLVDNLFDITAVTGDIIGGAGKLGDTVPAVIHSGGIYSFAGLGIHLKTYFFGIYPEMISIYAAKAFGNGVSSEYGVRYYFGLNQPF